MRRLLAVVLLLAVLLHGGDAERRRKHRRLRTTTETPAPAQAAEAAPAQQGLEPPERGDAAEAEDEQVDLALMERMHEQRFQESERTRVLELINQLSKNQDDEPENNEVFNDDPCVKVHCSAGRVCELTEAGEAVCNCIKECPYETEIRRKVCTNHNETWPSDCAVYQQRCQCLEGSPACKGPDYLHVQIEYYGACKEMPECTTSEMSDFPRRMRDWLFNIMRDLAERSELNSHYLKMEREAEANLTVRWTNAAIWKWCDLDAHDNDRAVSIHELFPIRAPLMSLEHCIAPFLDSCDEDADHRITLHEWGRCLQLDEYELEDRCDQFTEDAE